MKLTPDDFVVFRRALLPFETLQLFHQNVQSDPGSFFKNLRDFFSDPFLRRGLEICSPTFYAQCLPFLKGEPAPGEKKIAITLYKYLIRTCSRATPFGLFAGYFVSELTSSTAITFDQTDSVSLYHQLDGGVLQVLQDKLLSDAALVSKLNLITNSSVYQTANVIRLVTSKTENAKTDFQLTQAERNFLLESVLDVCTSGLPYQQVIGHLQDLGITRRQAKAYLTRLIDAQILLTSLQRNVIGPTYLDYLESHIVLKQTKYHKHLKKLQDYLSDLQLEKVQSTLQRITGPGKLPSQLVHTTARFTTKQNQLSYSSTEKIAHQLEKLLPLLNPKPNKDLDDFASRLHQRYGQRKVPLLTALDYDYGTGYGKLNDESSHILPLLDYLHRAPGPVKAKKPDKLQQLINELYSKVSSPRQMTVELTDEMIRKITPSPQVPSTSIPLMAMGRIHSENPASFDRQQFSFELSAFTTYAAWPLLARFCMGDDGLTTRIQSAESLRQKANDQVIFADIAHLPSPGASNILQRPDLTSYEITYMAGSVKNSDRIIRAQDLDVSSPDGKSLTLYSSKLRKQIQPVLYNAHHFGSGLPVYKFLCDLATRHITVFNWNWAHLSDAVFLPRLVRGNLILSKASWQISYEQLENVTLASEGQLVKIWKPICEKMGIPRYFTTGSEDQQLLIDSESELSLSLLMDLLKKNGRLRITEFLGGSGNGLLGSKANHYVNEIIIPLTCRCDDSSPQPKKERKIKPTLLQSERSFILTSQWLYVKIYCSSRLSDKLIGYLLRNLCQKMLQQGLIDKWFFVRYQDPSPHLRFRFHSNQKDFWIPLLKELHQLLAVKLADGTVQSISTDTYQREIERYQPPYDQIESFFYIDSMAVSQCLTGPAPDADLRWLLALLGTDLLLDDLALSIEQKLLLVSQASKHLAAEFDQPVKLIASMNLHYRSHSQKISQTLKSRQLLGEPFASKIFQERSKHIRILLKNPGVKKSQFTANAPDLVHMFLNRWFYTHQREQELVCYHYLKKYYTTTMKTYLKGKNIPKSSSK
ncbi:hypothetical protein DSL64_26960 [Dyadobacter luteus]|uniref:Lantibiotic dehydratase n=1 Tax=Dyadobacter luteus TaxID=2259619 RepID=A0A3D8Y4J5_9BACT|nr:lantibiotic dehydratase [Dyadobacter luteus]REA56438.1 hypothetical protein DSL64_26960 [Dyadobacter luteus]